MTAPSASIEAARIHAPGEARITERFALGAAPEAFVALAARRGLKVIANPSAGLAGEAA
jgi:hypothetical protein